MTILLYLADEPDYYANNMYARFCEYVNERAYLQEHATILMEEDATGTTSNEMELRHALDH